jgi:predicted lactoylglutathione lyase
MIGYVTLGTNDIKRSAAFYDKLLAEIGAKRLMEFENFIVWGNSPTQAGLSVTKPFDGNPATVGNGVMVALVVKEPAQVDRVYKKALELGAKDEGAAGPRGPGFYAGYFRDLVFAGRAQPDTFSTSLPKFSPLNSFSSVSGKVSRPATISSRVLSLPAASQPAISRIASG